MHLPIQRLESSTQNNAKDSPSSEIVLGLRHHLGYLANKEALLYKEVVKFSITREPADGSIHHLNVHRQCIV